MARRGQQRGRRGFLKRVVADETSELNPDPARGAVRFAALSGMFGGDPMQVLGERDAFQRLVLDAVVTRQMREDELRQERLASWIAHYVSKLFK